jgi:hypothetical protein
VRNRWSVFFSGRAASLLRLAAGSIPIVLVGLLLVNCAGSAQGSASPPATRTTPSGQNAGERQQPSSSGWDLSPRRNDAGQVSIDVTPLTLGDDVWEFEVALNTHSVNLDFDVTKVSALRCDQGREYLPVAWDGSGPGGHHRSGVLKFTALDHPTSSVEIVIRDVASVPERVFEWDTPSEAASPVGGIAAGSSIAQPSATAGDGPPQVGLSGQEFHFGDVVMSQGAVQETIEITNAGSGILHIEGTEPT